MQENEIVKLLQTVISRMDSFEENAHKRFDDIEKGQQESRQDQDRLESKVDKLEIRMENEVIERVGVLFDAREVQNDINQQILNTLQRVEAKIDVLQMETAHIRRVK